MKNNYIVTQVDTDGDGPTSFVKVASELESTRDAVRWVKNYGGDGIAYAVMKITKVVEVETVSSKRIRDRSDEG